MYNTDWSSNNPFVTDPNNPHIRFPDISSLPSPPLQAHSIESNQEVRGYQFPSPQTSPTFGNQPFYVGQGLQQPTGAPFQPSSAFGQQLAANMSGSSYGYLNGQSTGQSGYHPAQEQLRSNSNYIAQFDPYAPSPGQGWNAPSQPSPQSPLNLQPTPWSPTYGSAATSTSPMGNPHPREYLRTHKSELEAWDRSAWNQLLNVFDSLKNAWEGHAKELEGRISQLQMQYIGAYHPTQIQQEQARFQGVGFFLSIPSRMHTHS